MYTFDEAYNASLDYFDGDDIAANVWVSKYALQDKNDNYLELTPTDMHRRLAREFARVEAKYPNALTEDEIFNLFTSTDENGKLKFGAVIPQGSPMSAVGNTHQIQSTSNCFVIDSPADSYGGILLADQEQVQIMKRRGGVGFDISNIRPKGLTTENAAKTTDGIGVFMERFSNSCREVAQDGRRGALLMSISCHHPDIQTFIDIKKDKTKVTGANISIRISDEFMHAVRDKKQVELRWPVDSKTPTVSKMVDAQALWFEIASAAHDSAEPGVLFWDTATRMSSADAYTDAGFGSISTNPCLTGDTLIAVADGRNAVSIKTLADEGADVPVYCCDDNGKIVIRTMRNPRLTGKNSKIIKITLDDGTVLRSTLNHKYLTVDGNYVEASSLKTGDALHVAWRHHAALNDIWTNSNSHSQDYIWLRSAKKKTLKSEHRLVYEFANGTNSIPKHHVIHHIDYDGKNNCLANLQCMSKIDHDEFHSRNMMGEKNPVHKILADPIKAANWKRKLSIAGTGIKNGNSCGLDNSTLFTAVSNWIYTLGYVPTCEEYKIEAKKNNWPQIFVEFRTNELGDISHFLFEAALHANIKARNVPSTSSDPNIRIEYWRTKTDLPLKIVDNDVIAQKKCEVCNNDFDIIVTSREIAFCSRTCSARYLNNDEAIHIKRVANLNTSWKLQAEKTKCAQLDVYTKLKYVLNREPMLKEWDEKCKELGVPRRLGSKYAFPRWADVQQAAALHNHRIVLIEDGGHEDVYTGTVDDYHNFYTMCNETKSIYGKSQWALINSRQCGEIVLSAYDSCRLMVVNLSRFVKNPYTSKATFSWAEYASVVQQAQRLMDDLIDLELEAIDNIINKIKLDPQPERVKAVEFDLWHKIRDRAQAGRRTGLGPTAVGDVIAMMNLKYGSDESVALVEKLYQQMAINSYMSSIDMAEQRGAFLAWNIKNDEDHPFLDRIKSQLTSDYIQRWQKYGRRNIANMTTAPTGSVSLLARTSSGIEPTIFLKYLRKKKINSTTSTDRTDSIDANGDHWMHFGIVHPGVVKWMHANNWTQDEIDTWINGTGDSLEGCPYQGATANDIPGAARVQIQAAAQRWVDHAISSTCNLPSTTTVDEVKDIYMMAWEMGCKGITVYREGSRTGVLVREEESSVDHLFIDRHAPKRPESLDCEIHRTKIKGDEWAVFVGLFEGKPYEVFGGLAEHIVLPSNIKHGKIVKRSLKAGGKYDLICGDEADPIKIKDIVKQFDNPNYSLATRFLSTMLRHGTPIQYVVEQLKKDREADMFSFARVMARTLKHYINDGVQLGEACDECGTRGSMVYSSGCEICTQCGHTACG